MRARERCAQNPKESALVVIRHVSAGSRSSTQEKTPVSLPRVKFLDGEFTPADEPMPMRRVEVLEEHAPTDWVGRPLYRTASKCKPLGAREDVNAEAIARQRRRQLEEQVRTLLYKTKVAKITDTWRKILASRRRTRMVSGHIDSSAILSFVAEMSGYTVPELIGPGRPQNIVHWRMIAAYIIRKHRPVSLPFIGKTLGGRDHSTIMHSIRKVESNYSNYAADIERVEALL